MMEIPESDFHRILREFSGEREGGEAYAMAEELFPICRSITGDGLRESLGILQKAVPLEILEVPTGTGVFDWTVPKEWNIRDAYIKNEAGARIVDFRENNLHVLNYSIPVEGMFSLEDLRPHLHSLPESPEWIPYRTSYFREDWGFCLRHRDLEKLGDGGYEVRIDSTLEPGHLSYGEYLVKGETEDEVLISCHSCHPSLCNDNLAGMTVAARLAALLGRCRLRYTYRFVWAPGTIGAITWLSRNEGTLGRIKHGLVLSCLGDQGEFTYKRSRRGNADIDRAVEYVLTSKSRGFEVQEFEPYGYDERQYCSPGINLPVGCLMRTPHGKYPEYHTSADDLSLISASALGESLETLLHVIEVLEENRSYLNLNPMCEPQLGRRGLYRQMGGVKNAAEKEMAMLWVLNLSDGVNDVLEIAGRSGMNFTIIAEAVKMLQQVGLLEEKTGSKTMKRMDQNMTIDEIAWWDQWNCEYRTKLFHEWSDAEKTGKIALSEVFALQLDNPRILEVGCGTGWLADQLMSQCSYIGLDLSPAAIEVASGNVPSAEFYAADFCSWECDDASFDVILMVDTIAYFRDQNETLKKAARLLKQGGYLILTTVNPFVYSRMSWIGPPAKGQVRNWLSRRVLHGYLEANGLRIQKSSTLFPEGNQGILRVINSGKLNRAMFPIISEARLRQFKERMGLGQYRLVVSQLNNQETEVEK